MAEKLQRDLIAEYPDVFKQELHAELPDIKPGDATHVIKVKHEEKETPSRGYYPVPLHMYAKARDVVLDHVKGGRLVPSSAPRASPVFFKPKKEPGVPPRM